jgi:hypothetical protein
MTYVNSVVGKDMGLVLRPYGMRVDWRGLGHSPILIVRMQPLMRRHLALLG